ncbi:putative uncharacterized protein [Rhodococcus sp. AW25M09]|nr:putative uncharacterized protein [Rhodococcus sp. AW25M09]
MRGPIGPDAADAGAGRATDTEAATISATEEDTARRKNGLLFDALGERDLKLIFTAKALLESKQVWLLRTVPQEEESKGSSATEGL